MKSTVFSLDPHSPVTQHLEVDGRHTYKFTIPLLPAYAIEYFTIQIGALSTLPELDVDRIEDRYFFLTCDYELGDMSCFLVIHYHGIRDYALLFPTVSPIELQNRLGDFYREAEANFDSGAWLSFLLMCGALFEGFLYASTSKKGVNTFEELIDNAFDEDRIDLTTKDTMHSVRKFRNLVHAKLFQKQYVTRANAMDTRIVLDRLLRGA
jgi:hypothetical protein